MYVPSKLFKTVCLFHYQLSCRQAFLQLSHDDMLPLNIIHFFFGEHKFISRYVIPRSCESTQKSIPEEILEVESESESDVLYLVRGPGDPN